MEILTSFITNLIVFIMLSVIIDMLLPNSVLQKYTKLVIGLLLIAIMISPIVQIFQTDFTSKIEETLSFATFKNDNLLKNKIEVKKKEINTANRAYILEQMAVQLKEDAEGELMDTFHYKVADVQITMKDNQVELKAENMKQVEVILQKGSESEIKAVQPVEVTLVDKTEKQDEQTTEIRDWLGERWGLDKKIIEVKIDKEKE